MKEYRISLKNEKKAFYNVISLIAVIANALIFITYCFYTNTKTAIITNLVCVGLIAAGLLLNLYQVKNKKGNTLPYYFFFLLLAVEWLILGHYKLSLIPVLFAAFSAIATRKMEVSIGTKEITYPSFPQRYISWQETTHVMLKDELLTIDLKNNKLYQEMIDPQQTAVNEKEFNEFCLRQLTASN